MWKIGQVIDNQYTVLDVLQGGMGIVYIVDGQNQLYAVKTLQDRYASRPGWQEQFEQEAYTWMKLGIYHHIVRAFFVERFDGQPYVFSEAIQARRHPNTLRGWIQSERLDAVQAALFAVQFCKGMEYSRQKGVSGHFDIKPENVMIDDGQNVKITDWGLSRLQAGAMQPSGSVLSSSKYQFHIPEGEPSRGGTLPYMAPELFSGAEVTGQVDLYAFGVMLYEMTTGKRPFEGRTSDDFAQAHLHQAPAAPRQVNGQVPAVLSNLIMHCLEKNPNSRPQGFTKPMEFLAHFVEDATGKPISLEIEPQELSEADARQAAMGMHKLGRDEEAMQLMQKGAGKMGVVMWDDREHGFTATVSPQEFEEARAKLAANPHDPKAWEMVGLYYSIAEKYDQAIEHYQRALKTVPDESAKWKKGIEDARRAKNRILVDEMVKKGDALSKEGQYGRAQTLFQEALELDDLHAIAWYNLGVCQMSLGELQGALGSLKKAVSLDNQLVQAWTNLGALQMQTGNPTDALKSLEQACEIEPNHAKAWLNRGGVLQMLGRDEEALQCFERALEIDPHYEKARQARQMMLSQQKAGNDPVQEMFNAFQRAGSLDEMRRAVQDYPMLADERVHQLFEQAINGQVPREQHAMFKQRLDWLRQASQKKKKGWFGLG